MKAPHSGIAGKDWDLQEEPLYFSGIPGHCVGNISFINKSDQKIKVRSLDVEDQDSQAEKKLGKSTLSLRAKMPAQTGQTTRATLQIAPETPPGIYDVFVSCGDNKMPAKVRILDNTQLNVEPSHIKLKGASGDKLSTALVFENSGNTPILLNDVAMVWLEEINWVGRTTVYSLRDIDETSDHSDLLNQTLGTLKKHMLSPTSIKLEPRLKTVLQPGERFEKEMKLTLPKGMLKGKQYKGFIKLNEATLWLEVDCNGSENSTKRR